MKKIIKNKDENLNKSNLHSESVTDKPLTASGITLISLVVTMIVLLLIASISVKVSIGVYQNVIIESYIAKMKIIQSGVDNFVSSNNDVASKLSGVPKLSNSSDMADTFIKNGKIDVDGLNIDIYTSWNSGSDNTPSNYYLFTSENLEKYLGVNDANMTVIINFNTRNIISYECALFDDVEYHRQYDLGIGDKLIQ